MSTQSIETAIVDGAKMDILIDVPDGKGPFPAVIIGLQGLAYMGVNDGAFSTYFSSRLSDEGFVCATPFLFHRCEMNMERGDKVAAFIDDEIVADLNATLATLQAMSSVDSDRIGIMGHCLGGRVAYLGAATNPTYKCLAFCYGGNIRKPWGHEGEAPIDLVANIKCPVIGFFGNDDTNPSPDDVDAYEAAFKAAGANYEFHRYDDTGHAFQDKFNEPMYREAAAKDSWSKLLPFLKGNLGA